MFRLPPDPLVIECFPSGSRKRGWWSWLGGRGVWWGRDKEVNQKGREKGETMLGCSLVLFLLQLNWSSLTAAMIPNSLQMFSLSAQKDVRKSPITQKHLLIASSDNSLMLEMFILSSP